MIPLLIGVLLFFVVASVVAFLAAHVFVLWFCITLALVLLWCRLTLVSIHHQRT